MSSTTFITNAEILQHWLAHRNLTRKTIEKFPEKELFEFSIGGMRPFAELVNEFFAIDVPGLKGFVTGKMDAYAHDATLNTKEAILKRWDENTPRITEYFNQISEEKLNEQFSLFGQYQNTIRNHILYFIDNEIHHRAQGFVYLRALNIEPPFFWDR